MKNRKTVVKNCKNRKPPRYNRPPFRNVYKIEKHFRSGEARGNVFIFEIWRVRKTLKQIWHRDHRLILGVSVVIIHGNVHQPKKIRPLNYFTYYPFHNITPHNRIRKNKIYHHRKQKLRSNTITKSTL